MRKLVRTYPNSLWSSNHVDNHNDKCGSYCHSCHSHITWAEYFSIAENFPKGQRTVHSCGKILNYGNIQPFITDESIQEALSTVANTEYWYHATQRSNWLDQVQRKNVLVHVGDEIAALSQADIIYKEKASPVYLHRFKIQSDQVNPLLLKDVDHWESALTSDVELIDVHGATFTHDPRYSAYPYINVFENPGSVSILTSACNIIEETVTTVKLSRR